MNPEKSIEQQLSDVAWKIRTNAIARKTKVGCAITANGKIFAGCNIEHDWCTSLHAEVVAISKAVSNNHTDIEHVLIVSDKEAFTPCGACLDWLFMFCKNPETVIVGYQNNPKAQVVWFSLKELMPHYPQK